MGQTVNPNSVHARIVQRNLDSATRSRVVLADVLNIFTQTRNKTHWVPFPSSVVLCMCATFPKVPTTVLIHLFPNSVVVIVSALFNISVTIACRT